MKFLGQLTSLLLALSCCLGVGVGAWWIITQRPTSAKADKPPPAATVARPIKEEDLNTITLTPEAENRLGVQTGTVAVKNLRRHRVYAGEIIVPPGQTIVVSAPLGGMIRAPEGAIPRPGQRVKKGQPALQLLPLLTPEARTTIASAQVDAEGQMKNAQTQRDAANIALVRNKNLLKQGAGSQRNVDEAQAAFDLAGKALEAAQARRDVMVRLAGEFERGTAAPLMIETPEDGILRALSVLPGQTVPPGAPLFEVVDLDRVWVRVALPVGDLEEIAHREEASIGSLTVSPGAKTQRARPVAAPPSANPIAGTIDLYYELENPQHVLIPGQRMGVTLALQESQEMHTVPWSAVVFDIHGGTWVYEKTTARVYVRRRVTIRHVVGAEAVLGSGPALGTSVVSEGAQELFGAEMGFSK